MGKNNLTTTSKNKHEISRTHICKSNGRSKTESEASQLKMDAERVKAAEAQVRETEKALAVNKGMYEGRGGGMLQLVDDTGKGVYGTIKIGNMGGGTLHWNAHRVLQLMRDLSMTPPSFSSCAAV